MSENFPIYLLVMAGVTYLVRMLPMVLIKKEIQNKFILAFLHYIPYAVLAVMTVPAVFFATSCFPSAVVGVVIAVILAYFERSLLTVAFGSCAGVFLTEWILSLLGK